MSQFAAALVVLSLALVPAQERQAHACGVDLTSVGQMRDILSNALTRGLDQDETRVREVLKEAREDCSDGDELLRRTAAGFGLDEAVLRDEVARYHHVNCGRAALEDGSWVPEDALTEFAADVTMHVVLHELGHAVVREFDLPVLGNEETLADAFATHVLVTHLPERAPAVLRARVASLWYEAGQVARAEWDVDGEHDSDARRAHQIAALALAADPERYREVADVVGMSDRERRKARDWGSEVHRSWRRTLAPLWMPAGMESKEARVVLEVDERRATELRERGLLTELEGLLRRFDWHSQVTLRFVPGDGGAAWSRNGRTITVHEQYLKRFVDQGRALARVR